MQGTKHDHRQWDFSLGTKTKVAERIDDKALSIDIRLPAVDENICNILYWIWSCLFVFRLRQGGHPVFIILTILPLSFSSVWRLSTQLGKSCWTKSVLYFSWEMTQIPIPTVHKCISNWPRCRYGGRQTTEKCPEAIFLMTFQVPDLTPDTGMCQD